MEKDIDDKLIALITQTVMEKLKENDIKISKRINKYGIINIKGNSVKCQPFDTGNDNNQVFLKDIVTIDESPNLMCGFMEMKESCFPWTLKYDEVDYIIEGTLEIIIDDEKIVGNEGDVIFIPQNSEIKFSTPTYVRFFYVTYPANWSEL